MSEQQQEYGGIIINGIDCSGGGGSSVTPNPPAPATETLSSLDINGVVYGIEQETRENIFSIFDTFNLNDDCSSGQLVAGDHFTFGINDARNDWSGSTTIYNNNAYDLTDIDKLELVVEVTQQSDYAYLWLTFSNTKYTWGTSSWPGVYQNKTSALQISQSGSYEVDVSELTGNYYIYIGATSGKDDITPGDCNNTHNGVIAGTVTEFNIISSSIGTSVTPNPDGSATEVLKKIKIDEDIYKVADVEEVTEEQYTALPSTKNSDDTVYMVKHIEDIFDDSSTISLLGGNGITLESSSVTGKIGTLSAYEYSAGYEGFNIALQNLTVGQTYKLEFDFQFTNAQFIGNDYRCAYLISATQKTNYTDYTQWTDNLPRDLIKHHQSIQFTASATTMYLSFNLSGCSDNVNNYFTMNNIYVINITAQNKIMLNGNQYGVSTSGGDSTVIANPSGTATATLNKVSIDGIIYDIPSGGSGGTTSTLLYKATDHTKKTFELSENWDNYDSLLVTMLADDPTVDATFPATTINVASITDGMIVGLGGNGYTWYKLNPTTDKKTFTYWISNSSYYIDSVVGVKQATSGGGGEGYTRDTLYNSQITTPQQVTLSNNIDDYDVLEVVVAGGTSLTPYQIDVNYFKEACPYVANPTYENDHWIIHTYQNRYIRIIMGDTNNKIYPYDINNQTIEEINGIKYNISGGGGNVDDVYVNGESVLDANKIAQVKTHVEKTTADYYNIPEEIRNTDNVLYAITDDGIHLGDTFSPIIYSTEEREIGVWTDNKPLYRKVFDFTSSPISLGSSWANTSISSTDIDKIVTVRAFHSDGTVYEEINADPTRSNHTWVGVRGSGTAYYLMLEYTKLSDVAGSGSYNTLGVPTVHYTTDEQVIGTYFGKPLYQKSFDGLNVNVNNNSWYNITNIPNGKDLIDIKMWGMFDEYYMLIPCQAHIDSTKNGLLEVLFSGLNTTRTVKRLAVQYTKTTDL